MKPYGEFMPTGSTAHWGAAVQQPLGSRSQDDDVAHAAGLTPRRRRARALAEAFFRADGCYAPRVDRVDAGRHLFAAGT